LQVICQLQQVCVRPQLNLTAPFERGAEQHPQQPHP
jgi:hypothetical protein